MDKLSMMNIFISLTLSIFIGGVIGYEREQKNRPAGMRTHILVCVGATIIALIQKSIGVEAIQFVQANPEMASLIRVDQARLTAQVISGIGFLGAGTIIVTKQRVLGLTTAASIWACAALGIGSGMGYYYVTIPGFMACIFSLSIIKKIITVQKINNLEIKYVHRQETKEFINHYFEKNNIQLDEVTFEAQVIDDIKYYKNIFTFDLPRQLSYADVIEELSLHPNIVEIRLVSVNQKE